MMTGKMIYTFPTLIEDADILTVGTVKVMIFLHSKQNKSVLSKDDTRRFCLWGNCPCKREYEKYGKC